MPKGANMFHGEKGERYLYKGAADISCRVWMYLVPMESGVCISCVRKSVVDISSANLASLPPLPFLLFLVMTHHCIVTVGIGFGNSSSTHLIIMLPSWSTFLSPILPHLDHGNHQDSPEERLRGRVGKLSKDVAEVK